MLDVELRLWLKEAESVHFNRHISATENARVIHNNSTIFPLKLNPPMQGTARARHVPI